MNTSYPTPAPPRKTLRAVALASLAALTFTLVVLQLQAPRGTASVASTPPVATTAPASFGVSYRPDLAGQEQGFSVAPVGDLSNTTATPFTVSLHGGL